MLYDFLHAFGAGFAFCAGVIIGGVSAIVLAGYACKKDRDKGRRATDLANARLEKYVYHVSRIADVMERMEEK
jgi:gas vesicle protein